MGYDNLMTQGKNGARRVMLLEAGLVVATGKNSGAGEGSMDPGGTMACPKL